MLILENKQPHVKAYHNQYFDWIQSKHYDSVESYEAFVKQHPESVFVEEARKASIIARNKGRIKTATFCEQLNKICLRMPFELVEKEISQAIPLIENSFTSAYGTYNINMGSFEYRGGRLSKCSIKESSGCSSNRTWENKAWVDGLNECVMVER